MCSIIIKMINVIIIDNEYNYKQLAIIIMISPVT